jgi:ABC-type multidrug transport system fused ATPase/permease subunit
LELGERFSSGERQRLAIARAFLKNGSLVLLDEPVSHLDVLSGNEISILMKQLLENRTTITIAHHVSSMKMADEILVLRSGKLVQSGTYDDLSNGSGYFTNLLNSEAG